MNFDKVREVHFTGIKGVGMTALALCFKDMGLKISGSDTSEIFVTDEILKRNNINYSRGINKSNIPADCDLLITTGAHGGLNNPEVIQAKKRKIKVLTYAEALSEISFSKETLCVCGVGGKSTISSMAAVLLDSAGLDPSYVVGVGNIYPLGTPGRYVKESRNFICESDEYVVSPGVDNRAKFSLLSPKMIIATNIEYDHPDVYPSFEDTKKTFLDFFNKVPKFGYLIASSDNKNTREIILKTKVNKVTYGFDKSSDYQIKNVKFKKQNTIFSIYIKGKKKLLKDLSINVPGDHNIKNAAAVIAYADLIGIEDELIRKGLKRYLGCRRRFEEMPHYKGADFFDDYAHHPSEIENVIKAAREWFEKRRIIVIFQPHTYSRTKALLGDFSKSLCKADIVGIMDIYSSAREKTDLEINSKILVEKTKKYMKDVYYLGGHDKTVGWIKKNIKAGDVVLTLGAGDIFHLYEELKEKKN